MSNDSEAILACIALIDGCRRDIEKAIDGLKKYEAGISDAWDSGEVRYIIEAVRCTRERLSGMEQSLGKLEDDIRAVAQAAAQA